MSGQLAYLDYLKENNLNIKLVINIDGVGHIGSENHFSFYNFNEKYYIHTKKDKKELVDIKLLEVFFIAIV